jgi:nicotinamide mononucleotide adenylyltransferase
MDREDPKLTIEELLETMMATSFQLACQYVKATIIQLEMEGTEVDNPFTVINMAAMIQSNMDDAMKLLWAIQMADVKMFDSHMHTLRTRLREMQAAEGEMTN